MGVEEKKVFKGREKSVNSKKFERDFILGLARNARSFCFLQRLYV